jgi:hypothetical protein
MTRGNVLHHRDDFAELIFLRQVHANLLADRILVGEVAAHHGLVDDGYPRRGRGVAIA